MTVNYYVDANRFFQNQFCLHCLLCFPLSLFYSFFVRTKSGITPWENWEKNRLIKKNFRQISASQNGGHCPCRAQVARNQTLKLGTGSPSPGIWRWKPGFSDYTQIFTRVALISTKFRNLDLISSQRFRSQFWEQMSGSWGGFRMVALSAAPWLCWPPVCPCRHFFPSVQNLCSGVHQERARSSKTGIGSRIRILQLKVLRITDLRIT